MSFLEQMDSDLLAILGSERLSGGLRSEEIAILRQREWLDGSLCPETILDAALDLAFLSLMMCTFLLT